MFEIKRVIYVTLITSSFDQSLFSEPPVVLKDWSCIVVDSTCLTEFIDNVLSLLESSFELMGTLLTEFVDKAVLCRV